MSVVDNIVLAVVVKWFGSVTRLVYVAVIFGISVVVDIGSLGSVAMATVLATGAVADDDEVLAIKPRVLIPNHLSVSSSAINSATVTFSTGSS